MFPGRRALIFANGCFWHGHNCHLFRWPKSRAEFWRDKIGAMIARDHRVREQLLEEGWRVAEVWECTLKGREQRPLEQVLADCDAFLGSDEASRTIGGGDRVIVTGAP